jgi:hypothetical protein
VPDRRTTWAARMVLPLKGGVSSASHRPFIHRTTEIPGECVCLLLQDRVPQARVLLQHTACAPRRRGVRGRMCAWAHVCASVLCAVEPRGSGCRGVALSRSPSRCAEAAVCASASVCARLRTASMRGHPCPQSVQGAARGGGRRAGSNCACARDLGYTANGSRLHQLACAAVVGCVSRQRTRTPCVPGSSTEYIDTPDGNLLALTFLLQAQVQGAPRR